MFCKAGPVASFIGLWHDAQFDMNRAFPSGSANAGTWPKSKTITSVNILREHILYSGLNDSGTGINLKINFPLYKSVGKTTTQSRKFVTFLKKNSSILARVSGVFLL